MPPRAPAPRRAPSTHEARWTALDPLDALDDALRASVVLREAARPDYAALARFHYRPLPPATIVDLLAIAHRQTDEPIGVLTVSMPTLNGAWRPRGRRRRLHARRLNETLRTISRVIVDPRHRCRGVATALVRAYLARPLTPHTEAIAAMGDACRFFARAGMTPFRPGCPARTARLLEALHAANIAPWILADPSRAEACFRADPTLRTALRRWANDSRATRPLLAASPIDLAREAARALLSERIVYVHTTPR
jgi:GNAT superfamily N-acetyltransferase